MVCHDIQYMHDKEEMPMTDMFKEQYEDHMHPSTRTAMVMKVRTNMPVSSSYPNQIYTKSNELSSMAKTKALAELRDYFLTNNILEGNILKTKFPKVDYEDIYNSYKYGTDCKACVVQHISFGKGMNKLIHDAFGYQLKRNKLTRETYLVFNDGETYDLERTLKETYYCDTIELRLKDIETKG